MISQGTAAVGGLSSSNDPAAERVGTRIYRYLRDQIVMGEITVGERLSVPKLALQFQVSRSPVRDAVLQLVREGLAEEEINRGAVVRFVSNSELADLYEVREVLEGAAARLAAVRFDAKARRTFLKILEEHEDAATKNDFRRHVILDALFHSEVRALAGNVSLNKYLDEIQGQVMVAMRSTSVTGGPLQAVADHRLIFEAIASGDSGASERTARAHICRLTRLLREKSQ